MLAALLALACSTQSAVDGATLPMLSGGGTFLAAGTRACGVSQASRLPFERLEDLLCYKCIWMPGSGHSKLLHLHGPQFSESIALVSMINCSAFGYDCRRSSQAF
jgi:hypothetical protein